LISCLSLVDAVRRFRVALSTRAPRVFAFNNAPQAAVNAGAADHMKVQSADITVPVIRAGVMYYKPGELGQSSDLGRKGGYVYYSPESISDPEYLDSVRRSPFNVGTHELNTGEDNFRADGAPQKVWYDSTDETVYASGILWKADNIDYVDQNKLRPGFGTSAYIEFRGVKQTPGTTPTGEKYDAVTTKLTNNHIAILPNIRDKKNVIVALNAMNEDLIEKDSPDKIVKAGDSGVNENSKEKTMPDEKPKIDEAELKNALDDIKKKEAENAEYEEMKNSINSIKNELADMKNAKNKAANADEKKEDEKPAENAEGDKEEKGEAANAKNAIMPGQEMVKDFADAYGVAFKATPSFATLAELAGVSGKSTGEVIAALNAKRVELKKGGTVAATNSEAAPVDFNAALASFG